MFTNIVDHEILYKLCMSKMFLSLIVSEIKHYGHCPQYLLGLASIHQA